jgi:hypothetical protein
MSIDLCRHWDLELAPGCGGDISCEIPLNKIQIITNYW